MTYLYACTMCGGKFEDNCPVSKRDEPRLHKNCGDAPMRRVITVPQLITQPFHLQEGNRFQGDAMDKLAYQRKYSAENREKRNEEDKSFSRGQADIQGSQVVKSFDTPSLIDMAKQQGAQIRG